LRENAAEFKPPLKKKRVVDVVESYGLILLSLAVFAFYLFWFLLFVVGSTRVGHQ
jgi:hypothetical protein